MNIRMIPTLQEHTNTGKIAITDATAVYAWCETRDDAAALWLCEKYRPLVMHLVSREVRNRSEHAAIVEVALREALSEMDAEVTNCRVGGWFARIALEVCRCNRPAFEEEEYDLAA